MSQPGTLAANVSKQPGPPASATDQAVYVSAETIGALVEKSPKSIYRLARQDPTFPAVQIGGTLRFHKARVLRWLEQRDQSRQRVGKQAHSEAKPASPQEGADASWPLR